MKKFIFLFCLIVATSVNAKEQFVNATNCSEKMDNYYFSGRWGGENYIDITFKSEKVMMPIKIYNNPQITGNPVVEINSQGLFAQGKLICGWANINCSDTGFKIETKESYKVLHFPFDYPAFREVQKRLNDKTKTVYPLILNDSYAFYDLSPLDKYVVANRKDLQKKGECD